MTFTDAADVPRVVNFSVLRAGTVDVDGNNVVSIVVDLVVVLSCDFFVLVVGLVLLVVVGFLTVTVSSVVISAVDNDIIVVLPSVISVKEVASSGSQAVLDVVMISVIVCGDVVFSTIMSASVV